MYQQLPFKGPPKFPQIGIFWFENKPSGNPAWMSLKVRSSVSLALLFSRQAISSMLIKFS
jgi:hypothetical protein